MKYVFILGRNPGLSIAELHAKLPDARLEYPCAEALLAEQNNSLDALETMSKLGGTIKIGRVLGECAYAELEDFLFSYLEKTFAGKKIFFGFSAYGQEGIGTNTIGKNLKTKLKEAEISSRHVISKEKTLSAVVVKTNKLLTRGAEFLLVKTGNKITVAQTAAVQEFEEFSYRDFGRPVREMEVGLLPPKVARIMLNLTGVSGSGKVLDPFCGFGTITTEAMIMGFTDLFASDLEESVLRGAKKNIEWVKRFFPGTAEAETKLFLSPAESVSEHFKKRELDAIVTEPYLGPIQKAVLTEKEAAEKAKNLGEIYFKALRDWEKILKPGGRVVMIFPAFRTAAGFFSMPVAEELKNTPYDILHPLPAEATRLPYINVNSQGAIIYDRPGQKVRREIYTLVLTK